MGRRFAPAHRVAVVTAFRAAKRGPSTRFNPLRRGQTSFVPVSRVNRDPLYVEMNTMDESAIKLITDIASSIDWSAWVTAIATIVLAVLTFVYVNLTRKILSAQSDPCVVLTVVHDEDRTTILQLVAKNVGTGIAHDVRFEFSRPIPARAFGVSLDDAKPAATMTEGPLIHGIPALGPGESRRIDWGQFGGLKAAIGEEEIVATCRFKKDRKEMPPVRCPLDVESFLGTVATESPASKAADELEKISKELQHLGSGFHKLKVEITSIPESKANDV